MWGFITGRSCHPWFKGDTRNTGQTKPTARRPGVRTRWRVLSGGAYTAADVCYGRSGTLFPTMFCVDEGVSIEENYPKTYVTVQVHHAFFPERLLTRRSSIASFKALILEEILTATYSMDNPTAYAKQHKHIRKRRNGFTTIWGLRSSIIHKTNISDKARATSIDRGTRANKACLLVGIISSFVFVCFTMCFVV